MQLQHLKKGCKFDLQQGQVGKGGTCILGDYELAKMDFQCDTMWRNHIHYVRFNGLLDGDMGLIKVHIYL